MGPWYRVFGTRAEQPSPADLLEHLQNLGVAAEGKFRGDDQGWFEARLTLPDEGSPLHLEHYLATEAGVRQEILSWIAWLETQEEEPAHARLIEHLVGTSQVFTLHDPGDEAGDEATAHVCRNLCRFLAGRTTGVYQVDRQGFFAADGNLLLPERADAGPGEPKVAP